MTKKAFAPPTVKQLKQIAEARAKGGLTPSGIARYKRLSKEEQEAEIKKQEERLGVDKVREVRRGTIRFEDPRKITREEEITRVLRSDLPLKLEIRKKLERERARIIIEREGLARPPSLFELEAEALPETTGKYIPKVIEEGKVRFKRPEEITVEERIKALPIPKEVKEAGAVVGVKKAQKIIEGRRELPVVTTAPKTTVIGRVKGRVESAVVRTVTKDKYHTVKDLMEVQVKPAIRSGRAYQRERIKRIEKKIPYESMTPLQRGAVGLAVGTVGMVTVYPETLPVARVGGWIWAGSTRAIKGITKLARAPALGKYGVGITERGMGTAVVGGIAVSPFVDVEKMDDRYDVRFRRPRDVFYEWGKATGEFAPIGYGFTTGTKEAGEFITKKLPVITKTAMVKATDIMMGLDVPTIKGKKGVLRKPSKRRISKAEMRKQTYGIARDPRMFIDPQKQQVGMRFRTPALKKRDVKEKVIRAGRGFVEVVEKGRYPSPITGRREGLASIYRKEYIQQFTQQKIRKGGELYIRTTRKQVPTISKRPIQQYIQMPTRRLRKPKRGQIFADITRGQRDIKEFMAGRGQLQAIIIAKPKMKAMEIVKYERPKLVEKTKRVQDTRLIIKKSVEITKKKKGVDVRTDTSIVGDKPRAGYRPGMFERLKKRVEEQRLQRIIEQEALAEQQASQIDLAKLMGIEGLPKPKKPDVKVLTYEGVKAPQQLAMETGVKLKPEVAKRTAVLQKKIQAGIIVTGLKTKPYAKSLIKSITALELAQIQKMDVATAVKQKMIMETAQKMKQRQAQISMLDMRMDSKTPSGIYDPYRPAKPIRPPKPPRRPPTPPPGTTITRTPPPPPGTTITRTPPPRRRTRGISEDKIRRIKRLKEIKQAYDVYVKRRMGKRDGEYVYRGYVKANVKPLTKQSAKGRLFDILDRYAQQSGYIKKSKGKAIKKAKLESMARRLRSKFRQAKRDPNIYVEKRQHAIDSPLELKDITYKGIKTRRKKRK